MTSRLEEKNVIIGSIYKKHKAMGMKRMTQGASAKSKGGRAQY